MNENPPLPRPIQRRMQKRAPLTYAQESLWFLQQLDPENIAYNSNHLVKFTGGMDRSSLEKALNELVRRHEPLRTLYPNVEGKPVQIVQPFESFSLPFMDFSNLAEEDKQQAIQRYTAEHGDKPYNLQQGPVVRFALLHLAIDEDELFFSSHHIGSDAWSWQVFLSELMQQYDSFCSGKDPMLFNLPIQYTDYALWQREWLSDETLAAFTNHWKKILSGDLPILELPTDRPRPIMQSFRGARYQFQFSHPLTSQVKGFCQKERITPFHLYLAVYAIMLMHYSAQEDIIIGCPFANRPSSEMNNMVGLFVNTLPIRVDLSGNPSVREFLEQVRETALDAFTWQAAPFDVLVSEISPERDLSRTPIFQVAINMRNVPKQYQISIDGLEIEEPARVDAPAPFELSLEFDDVDGSLVVSLQYNADLFDENSIIHMAAHYQNLLGELMSKTDRPIAELEMLTSTERKRILMDWNETATDFPQVCVQDLIVKQTKKNPDALAVFCNGNSLTYANLEKQANQLAHYLRINGVQAESRVGIYLPRTENSIVALLAILKAGGAYVPLDLTYPSERIAYMVNDSDPTVIITLSHLKSQLPEKFQKICLDTESDLIQACETEVPVPNTNNDSPIYVMYTSGSTGRPKGAVNIHKGIVNYLTHMKKQFHLGSSDSIIQLTSFSFDVSVFEIFGPLTYGGAIFLMDDTQMRDPDFINKAIIDHQVTHISMVPTMLRSLSESALAQELKKNNLRLILPAGEVLLKADVELARRAYGETVQLVNLYGPTECSIIHTTFTIPSFFTNGLQVIPIGKPVSNARAYILDKYFHPVPVGARGELFIGGIGVGLGYWNRPELTAERFLPDPFWQGGRMYRTGDIARYLPDGTICYLGRSDDQVKIRGYRVEPGEIEAVIAEFPGVKDAAVKFWKQEDSGTLAAYITLLENNREELIENLREYLADRLPFYMMPSVIMMLDELPLTPNGKCDYRALPTPEDQEKHERYLAPRNAIEIRLVAIWEKLLNVEQIGVRDNFFELGGHSLLAVQLFTLIQEEFGQSLPLLLLFRESTVEALATFLTDGGKTSTLNGVVPLQPAGCGYPLFILNAGLKMRNLTSALGAARPIYALYPFEEGQMVFRDSIQETAKIYYQCLTDFDPKGPYHLLGHSGYGLFALELARLLRKNGKKVAFLGLLDTFPSNRRQRVTQADRIIIYLKTHKNNHFLDTLKYIIGYPQRVIARWRHATEEFGAIKHQKLEGWAAVTLLLRSYKPKSYDGQVILFKATIHPAYDHGNPMEKWPNMVSGPFKIVTVEGDHMSILEPPQVNLLAEKILAILSENETA